MQRSWIVDNYFFSALQQCHCTNPAEQTMPGQILWKNVQEAKLQQVCNGNSLLTHMSATALKKLNIIQNKSARLINTLSTHLTFHSLHHQHTVMELCPIYKLHCIYSLGHTMPPPKATTSTIEKDKRSRILRHQHLLVPFHVVRNPDLEIYHHPFITIWSKS